MKWLDWFKKKKKEPAVAEVQMQAHPIHINMGSAAQIKRNNLRILRLKQAVLKGNGTPEIEAELAERCRINREMKEAIE